MTDKKTTAKKTTAKKTTAKKTTDTAAKKKPDEETKSKENGVKGNAWLFVSKEADASAGGVIMTHCMRAGRNTIVRTSSITTSGVSTSMTTVPGTIPVKDPSGDFWTFSQS